LGISEDASQVVATGPDGLASVVTVDNRKVRSFRKNLADFLAVFSPDGEQKLRYYGANAGCAIIPETGTISTASPARQSDRMRIGR
jgi:hypothetical protein